MDGAVSNGGEGSWHNGDGNILLDRLVFDNIHFSRVIASLPSNPVLERDYPGNTSLGSSLVLHVGNIGVKI